MTDVAHIYGQNLGLNDEFTSGEAELHGGVQQLLPAARVGPGHRGALRVGRHLRHVPPGPSSIYNSLYDGRVVLFLIEIRLCLTSVCNNAEACQDSTKT